MPLPPSRLRPLIPTLLTPALFSAALASTACDGSIGDASPGPNAPGHAAGAGGAGGAAASDADTPGLGGAGGAWTRVDTPFCSDGWIGIDDHTCFFAPPELASPPSVLFFLHGMTPPDALPTALQAVARQAATAHGFVAVFPRGEQGLCGWDPSVEDWW